MLTRCSHCNSDAIIPKSGLCPICGHAKKMNAQASHKPAGKVPENKPDTTTDQTTVSASAEETITDLDAIDKQKIDLLLSLGKSVWSDLKRLKNVIESFSNRYQANDTCSQTLLKSHRIAAGFIRDEITASVNIGGLFGFGRTIPVDLMDITSKGALISAGQKLGINKKIKLALYIKSGKAFVINAVVARHTSVTDNEYGLKFDRHNNELEAYLLEKKLVPKKT
ncbi:MAG: PilZ domain-containing protein [Methylovulum sp.]|nr:PilZ domain-containing protein [Methylovulum sp.]